MAPIKVVAHYADGRIIKGYTEDFLPNSPTFHVRPLSASAKVLEVIIEDLKGVCFVRDFAGDPQYKEQKHFPEGMGPTGKAVEVTFKDGEIFIGSSEDYDLKRPGFFVVPADPRSNNLRIFAVSRAVRKVRFI
jgi:hypothetical protein